MPSAVTVTRVTEADLALASGVDPETTSLAQLEEELRRPWSRLWVARDEGGVLVGLLVAWEVADELHVLNVAVAAPARRRGFGRLLMRAALDFASARRARQILLEVRRGNAGAIALYRSVGFFATNVRPRYYSDDEDAVEMALHLDPTTGEVVPRGDEVKLDA